MQQVISIFIVLSLAYSRADFEKWHTMPNGSRVYIETVHNFNWFEAINECNRLKMSLISVDSKNKHEQLSAVMRSKFYNHVPYLWTGGHDNAVGRRFQWISTGEVFSYTSWDNGEPNNPAEHCVLMSRMSLVWNDASCSTKIGFVCENNPMLDEKNAEIKVLKESCNSQANRFKETAEQLHLLKKMQEHEVKQCQALENLKQLYETGVQQLKEKQDAFFSIQKTSEEKLVALTNAQKEFKTSSDTHINEYFKELQNEFVAVKNSSTSQLVQQNEILLSLNNSRDQVELSKLQSEELENLRKTNEMLSNKLYTVLMKLYEMNMNRTTPNKYYNFYQNWHKN